MIRSLRVHNLPLYEMRKSRSAGHRIYREKMQTGVCHLKFIKRLADVPHSTIRYILYCPKRYYIAENVQGRVFGIVRKLASVDVSQIELSAVMYVASVETWLITWGGPTCIGFDQLCAPIGEVNVLLNFQTPRRIMVEMNRCGAVKRFHLKPTLHALTSASRFLPVS